MIGSVFVCEAESLEEVRALMESDVYYKSGVVSRVFRPACDFPSRYGYTVRVRDVFEELRSEVSRFVAF